MKKVINYLLLIVCVFTLFTIKAHAMYKGSDEIEARSYIIGTHQFTRATTLTTRHIMLAAQTIEGTDEYEPATLTDMKIYYKNASGAWVDAITGQSTTPPNLFKIEYIDLVYTTHTQLDFMMEKI